ncbi:amino acid permease [Mycobacterium pseudoshottsii]|uniref:amino acid permease n=1 Tax=Mycobacterium pseudoshottsii TaxID=265949 RepID=UPI0005610336|nr:MULTISPECIES: amino acid permease [Mycobacterium]
MAGTDSHLESPTYLQKRQLWTGSAGWLLLAGLGVSYVISGDYSGWNFGLARGGFGGLAIAAVVIAAMYLALVLSMAELSSALPAAGGGYTFARRALGPWGGFATGTAVLIEYSIAPAAIATFIDAYVQSLGLFGIRNGWWVYLTIYALFIGIHLSGVGEALKVMFIITGVALYIGLAGLVASFFSIIYAYSRQLFALSRAGYLPTALSITNSRKAPTLALIVPGVIGFALSVTGEGDLLLNMAVFGATLSYVLMMISHIVLRRRAADMARPYRTPGGIATSGFALLVAATALIATFLVDTVAALCCLGVFCAFILYFALYSRHQLVANSPDEELAGSQDFESELQ